jgi:regulator of telomere elongation helicase 1
MSTADVIFMPYNYLLDPSVRSSLGLDLQGAIIIFDEAHNLEDMACEAASFDLSAAEVAGCIEEVSRATAFVMEPGYSGELQSEDLLQMKQILLALEDSIDSIDIDAGSGSGGGFQPPPGVTKNGYFIYELLNQAQINFRTRDLLTEMCEKVIDELAAHSSASARVTKLEGFSKVLERVFRDEKLHLAMANNYRVHIHRPEPRGGGDWGKKGGKAKNKRRSSCFTGESGAGAGDGGNKKSRGGWVGAKGANGKGGGFAQGVEKGGFGDEVLVGGGGGTEGQRRAARPSAFGASARQSR